MKRWLAYEVSNEDFLERYSRQYAELLALWGPWYKGFGPVLSAFEITPSDVCYVNFARCWQTAGTRVYDAMDQCACIFPVSRLYDAVQPDAVLVLSGASVFQAYPALMQGIPRTEWQHFPGRRSFKCNQGDIDLVTSWLGAKLGISPKSFRTPVSPGG